MWRIKLISGEFCSRCHLIAPLLKKYAENNGLAFEEINVNDANPEDLEWEAMLPVIIRDGKHISYEETLQKITQ